MWTSLSSNIPFLYLQQIINDALLFQEFVQSVDQLLKVRAGTSTIKDRIIAMNEGINIMGSRVVEKVGI